LFDCPPREALLSRYAAAMQHILLQVDPAQALTVQKTVQYRLDVEAVELALRRPIAHLLTRKLQALALLAEATEGYHDYFANRRGTRVLAFAALTAAVLRTMVKKLKGLYLVRRYKLV
jgi:hypothetical protein